MEVSGKKHRGEFLSMVPDPDFKMYRPSRDDFQPHSLPCDNKDDQMCRLSCERDDFQPHYLPCEREDDKQFSISSDSDDFKPHLFHAHRNDFELNYFPDLRDDFQLHYLPCNREYDRRPRLFSERNDFKPDRFHGHREDDQLHFLPFGREDGQLYCLPCDTEYVQKPAFGYCKDCNEHLCEACYKHHRKPAPCRNHVLLDKDAMPQTQSNSIPLNDFDTCPYHDNELKFYCMHHNSNVCDICVTVYHRFCKIEYIPRLSNHLKDDEELNRIIAELKLLKEECKSKVKSAEESKKNVSRALAKILTDIQKFRKEINVRLDETERNMKEEANSLMNAEQKRLGEVLKTCKDVTIWTEYLESSLNTLLQRKQFNRLFIETKKAKAKYDELVVTANQLQIYSNLQLVGFVKNEAILDVLQKPAEMGKLMLTGEAKGRRYSTCQEELSFSSRSSSTTHSFNGTKSRPFGGSSPRTWSPNIAADVR